MQQVHSEWSMYIAIAIYQITLTSEEEKSYPSCYVKHGYPTMVCIFYSSDSSSEARQMNQCRILTRQSLGEFLFHLFSFLLLSAFCLLVLLTPFYLDQTFHKTFQLGLAWFNLTQLGSA